MTSDGEQLGTIRPQAGASHSAGGASARHMTSMFLDHDRAVRLLSWLFLGAFLVSVIHYLDNFVNYADYPQGRTSLNPPAVLIVWAWFFFTTAGLAGFLLFRRAPSALALALLIVYSGSGLIGVGHYVVPGALDMPWWRQAHIVLDILFGIALLSFAIRAALARRRITQRASDGD